MTASSANVAAIEAYLEEAARFWDCHHRYLFEVIDDSPSISSMLFMGPTKNNRYLCLHCDVLWEFKPRCWVCGERGITFEDYAGMLHEEQRRLVMMADT